MKAFFRCQRIGTYAVVALLAGCGGGSQLGSSPIQPNAPQTRANLALVNRDAGARVATGRSWMALEAKKSDLAYVSYFYGSNVLAFTYPGG
jgi:hypothetical protein